VLHNEALPEGIAEPIGQDSSHGIASAAGGEANDHLDRMIGPGLRLRSSCQKQRNENRTKNTNHDLPPGGISAFGKPGQNLESQAVGVQLDPSSLLEPTPDG